VPRTSKNPRKGRSYAMRAAANSPPPPALIMPPETPFISLSRVGSVESVEETRRVTGDLKFPGLGRITFDWFRIFRRRAL
jgi:hypothetical protein